MSDKDSLGFKYSVVDYDDKSIDFQLLFDKPEEVSINTDPETLIVNLDGFRDQEGRLISQKTSITVPLPAQIDSDLAFTLK